MLSGFFLNPGFNFLTSTKYHFWCYLLTEKFLISLKITFQSKLKIYFISELNLVCHGISKHYSDTLERSALVYSWAKHFYYLTHWCYYSYRFVCTIKHFTSDSTTHWLKWTILIMIVMIKSFFVISSVFIFQSKSNNLPEVTFDHFVIK